MLIEEHCASDRAYALDCLYVRVEGVSYCLAPWRTDMACSRYESWHWRPVPDPSDWRFGAHAECYSPVARFLAQIPPELLRLARRFEWMQIPVLRLLRLTPYAAQLAATEPFLLWLMAIAFQGKRFTAKQCLALFLLPRKKILAELMGEDPGVKYLTINIVHKLCLQRYDHNEYLMFMDMYRSGLFKAARHSTSICFKTLQSIVSASDRRSMSEFSSIAELLGKLPIQLWGEAYDLYIDCLVASCDDRLRMLKKESRLTDDDYLREEVLVHDAAMACRNLHDLRRLRDSFTGPLEPHEYPPFPLSPFAGSDTIVPITTAQELYEEGIAMKTFVYKHLVDAVNVGWVYVYRVLAPERGTISLWMHPSGPTIDSIFLPNYTKPSEESWNHAWHWLYDRLEELKASPYNSFEVLSNE